MNRFTSAGTTCRAAGIVALLACVMLSGCKKGDGYHVSGKVTFDGKPVPSGKIYFTPDGTKGNEGPPGYANIVDGTYNTASTGGKPTAGGAMIVRIEGFDPSAAGGDQKGDTSGENPVKALFPTYQTNADLGTETATKDFNVPAAAANRKDAFENRGGGNQIVP